MDTVVIGCRTLENELRQAMEESGCSYDIKWFQSGLHDVPKKLHVALQELIDEAQRDGYVRALLSMGYCGNSLAGLQTGELTLIIPRVDDCISFLLGSYKNRAELAKKDPSYFMTEGWLKGERNIWREYEYAINKYGEETGKEIFDMMFGHYHSLAMLDTKSYDLTQTLKESERIAKALNLEHKVIPGTISYVKKLMTGPWDNEDFVTIPPHSTISEKDLTLKS